MNINDLSSYYGLIAVSGPDAAKFLQGQLTCDILKISEKEPGFGAFCNQKGRIRALFRIYLRDDVYYCQLPIGLVQTIMTALKKYAMFSKVKIEDASERVSRIGMIEQEREFHAWKLYMIRNGIPEIWPETTEMFLPHYINLHKLGAISFTKGCYCGQEIIARMEYRANIKRGLKHIVLENQTELPEPGTEISFANNSKNSNNSRDSKENAITTGIIVTSCFSETNFIEALVETDILSDHSI